MRSVFHLGGQAGATAGGGNNALVPANAPIQPPQAFVDWFLSDSFSADIENQVLSAQNLGWTSFDFEDLLAEKLRYAYEVLGYGNYAIYLTGNYLTQSCVDNFLSSLAATGYPQLFVDISGGTNAVPPKQDAAYCNEEFILPRNGDENGHPKYGDDGTGVGVGAWKLHFVTNSPLDERGGAQLPHWEFVNADGNLDDYADDGDFAYPWLVQHWNRDSTVEHAGNASIQAILDNGGTVQTN